MPEDEEKKYELIERLLANPDDQLKWQGDGKWRFDSGEFADKEALEDLLVTGIAVGYIDTSDGNPSIQITPLYRHYCLYQAQAASIPEVIRAIREGRPGADKEADQLIAAVEIAEENVRPPNVLFYSPEEAKARRKAKE